MSFEGSKAILIKDLSGNTASIISGGGMRINSTTSNLASVFLQTSSGSGGVALTSTTSSMPYGIIVKNVSNVLGVSGVVLVGSSGNPPYTSGGYALAVGESVSLNISRPDFVRVYGTLSGVGVSWMGQY